MIDYLRGKVVHLEAEFVVVDVRGHRLSGFYAESVRVRGKSEEPVTVYTHHHVREDAIAAVRLRDPRGAGGCSASCSRCRGIGPRVALGVLAGGTPEPIAAAIQQENFDVPDEAARHRKEDRAAHGAGPEGQAGRRSRAASALPGRHRAATMRRPALPAAEAPAAWRRRGKR